MNKFFFCFWATLILCHLPCSINAFELESEQRFVIPHYESHFIQLNEASLEASELSALSKILSDQVPGQLYQSLPKSYFAKLHGIALKLHSENETALKALAYLEANKEVKTSSEINKEQYAEELAGWSNLLNDLPKKEDKKIAAYIAWLALEIDSDQEDAKKVLSAYLEEHTLNWSWTQAKDKDASSSSQSISKTKDLKKRSSIYTFSLESIEGQLQGVPLKLFSSLHPGDEEEPKLSFENTSSGSLKRSLKKAFNELSESHPSITEINGSIAYDNKNHKTIQSSPGLALYLMLRSHIDNFDIDNNVAVIGKIGEYKRVGAAGGLGRCIDSAIKNGFQYLIIPEANMKQFEDTLVQSPNSILWDIQILSVDTYEDALNFIKLKKSNSTLLAIEKFEAVQEILFKYKFDYNKTEVKELVKDILELEPGHVSARYIQMLSQKKAPKKLSYEGSLLALRKVTAIADPDLKSDKPIGNTFFYNKMMVHLRKNYSMLDSRSKKVQKAWVTYCRYANGYKSFRLGEKSETKVGQRLWEKKLKTQAALLKKAQKEKASLLKVLGEDLANPQYYKGLILEGY